ncbi:ketosteroid isomerase [Burkholderia lata]|uniref:Ketosteroid isomerase n=2 Tax=Burkholderia lata (strain ATCC 17760 / DSM 23089 / LMG 22485 / NCIMB 9086 / R18194 / 383) TaxID=482957 RepID=A0A6P2VQ87_BURL3|nr:ketosteroid isomerase [Burkholderia lata]
MKPLRQFPVQAAIALALSFGGFAAAAAAGQDTLPYSKDAAVRAVQQDVYDIVHRYETALNKGDTATIVDQLFAADGVAEWNDKRTYATRQQKIDGYDALFRIAKFSTVFAYDAIDVYGDTAVVRTHHHVGAAVIENAKKVVDLNREVFVLRKLDGKWKIVLYTFNTDPVQGEG